MRSITIHGMDDDLAARLERLARERGLSLNKTIKRLLAKALGIPIGAPSDRRADFEDLCGAWTRRQAKAFRESLRDLDRVDPGDWR